MEPKQRGNILYSIFDLAKPLPQLARLDRRPGKKAPPILKVERPRLDKETLGRCEFERDKAIVRYSNEQGQPNADFYFHEY